MPHFVRTVDTRNCPDCIPLQYACCSSSARALIIRLPMAGSFAQKGTSPSHLRQFAVSLGPKSNYGHLLHWRDVVSRADCRRVGQAEGQRRGRGLGVEFVAAAHRANVLRSDGDACYPARSGPRSKIGLVLFTLGANPWWESPKECGVDRLDGETVDSVVREMLDGMRNAHLQLVLGDAHSARVCLRDAAAAHERLAVLFHGDPGYEALAGRILFQVIGQRMESLSELAIDSYEHPLRAVEVVEFVAKPLESPLSPRAK
jgi:hypothetical protein